MSSIVLTGDTSGAITVSAPAVAGTNTITLPASTVTLSNTPAFSVKIGTNQSLSENTATKLAFNIEYFDTDSAFDTTNYRFTVPTGKAGKYFISGMARINSEANNNLASGNLYLYKNGSTHVVSADNFGANYLRGITSTVTAVMDLSEGDYLELYGYINSIDNTGGISNSGIYSIFSGYKLIA